MGVEIDTERLKVMLRKHLTDQQRYTTDGKLTLRTVMSRAADIADAVIDQMATEPTRVVRSVAKQPRIERPSRFEVADAKRQDIRRVLAAADGPLKLSEVMHRAHLTTGEASYLLSHTPGIERIDGRYLYRLTA